MTDLLGLSGAAKEIVDAISSGIGTLYKPRQIRKEADAQAYATLVRADADAQALLVTQAEAGDKIAARALERLKASLIKQQTNIEAIVERAILIANANENGGTSDQVDPDWMTQFINHAQNVSQDDLQRLWAAALAKEASRSGSISVRALDALRSLTRDDALAFKSFLVIRQAFGGTFHPADDDCLQRFGFHDSELRKLAELELIRPPKIEWPNFDNQLQSCYPLLTCYMHSISPHSVKIADHVVSIYGSPHVEMYAYELSAVGK